MTAAPTCIVAMTELNTLSFIPTSSYCLILPHWCDVDRIAASDNPELVSRLPEMLKTMRQRMENVIVQVNQQEDTMHLRQFWLTSYAFDIHSALGIGLECGTSEFERIANAF